MNSVARYSSVAPQSFQDVVLEENWLGVLWARNNADEGIARLLHRQRFCLDFSLELNSLFALQKANETFHHLNVSFLNI